MLLRHYCITIAKHPSSNQIKDRGKIHSPKKRNSRTTTLKHVPGVFVLISKWLISRISYDTIKE